MKISEHISFAKLADLAERPAPADEGSASADHLASCSRCAQELGRLQRVIGLMRTDVSTDAPRDVLAYAINIFRGREQSAERSLIRRMVAALTFDSGANLAPAFGVRSGQVATRQLLFSAEDNDIDLRISSEADRWIVAGQLLGGVCAGGHVKIEGESGSAETDLNDQCEFRLPPVSSGSYRLHLRFNDAEVEIPQLELRG